MRRCTIRFAPGFAALAALLVVSTPGCGQEAGSVRLRVRLEPGHSFRVSTSMEMSSSQTVMGREQQSSQSSEMVMLNEILSVDAGGVARVRVTYETIRFVQDGPMGHMEYDSADPPDPTPRELRPYAVLVGEAVTMEFAPDGSVGIVEGMEDLMPRMIEAMDVPPGPLWDQMAASLEAQWGPEGMGELMGKGMAAFPHGPVAVGQSWTTSTSVEKPAPYTAETTWTLRERRGGVAYLDVTTETRNEGSLEMGPMVTTFDLSGGMTGTAEIDESTGLTLHSRMEGEDTGTVSMSGGPMGVMTVPMTTRSVIVSAVISRSWADPR